jgi:hypothetical protein
MKLFQPNAVVTRNLWKNLIYRNTQITVYCTGSYYVVMYHVYNAIQTSIVLDI